LNEQLDGLVTQVSEEFEHKLGEKQKIIDELKSCRRQDGQDAEQQIARLVRIREELQHLSTKTLYRQIQS
jgi:hypothetical protein